MYSPDEAEIKMLKKQSEFFSDLYEKFDKTEHSKYQYIYNKFWTKIRSSVDFQKEIDTLQAQSESDSKNITKITRWFFIFLAGMAATNYFNNQNSIEGGLILFFFTACFGWVILIHHISDTARKTDITNLRRLILLLKQDLFECRQIDFAEAEKYVMITRDILPAAEGLTETDRYTMSKVNIDLNISIAESMGYEIPTFFDSFDKSFKQRV
jgi:hypothetical protein